jgi:hypothetical protein
VYNGCTTRPTGRFHTRAPVFHTAATLLSLSVVTGLFAYDLVGSYSFDVARPLTLASLALAAVLFIADAIVTALKPAESR